MARESQYLVESKQARRATADAARRLSKLLDEYATALESEESLGEIFGEDGNSLDVIVLSRIRVFKMAHRYVRAVWDHGDDGG